MVVRIGAAAVVVAIVVQHDEHRMGSVGVVGDVLVHHLVVEKRAVAAATVFVAFVAGGGDDDHARDRAGVGIDVLRVVRLVAERRAYAAGSPQVIELHPGTAAVGRIRIDLVGGVRCEQAGIVRMRIAVAGAIEVDIVDQYPIDAFGDERRNHARGEGRLGREHAGGIIAAAGPRLAVDVLVQLDLHSQVLLVEQRHQRMVIAERNQIEPAVAEAGRPATGLVVRTIPTVPHAAVDAGGFEGVEVFDQ